MAWIWPGIPHTHRLSSLIRQQSCVRDAGLLNKQTRLWSGESLRLQIQPLPAELLQFDLKGVERQSWCSAVKGKWTNTLPQFCATHPLWRESLMSHKYYRKLQWFHKVFRCTDGSPLFSFAPGCDLWAAAFPSQTQWPVAPLRICFILHVNLWLGFFTTSVNAVLCSVNMNDPLEIAAQMFLLWKVILLQQPCQAALCHLSAKTTVQKKTPNNITERTFTTPPTLLSVNKQY